MFFTMKAVVRGFHEDDETQVIELFRRSQETVHVPSSLADLQKRYIENAIETEVGRISDYYSERGGAFWVASELNKIIGCFGLVPNPDSIELRRMNVDAQQRRQGVGRKMLAYAEAECLLRNFNRITLSTSEFQSAAMNLYLNSGYSIRSATTIDVPGGTARTFEFEKFL